MNRLFCDIVEIFKLEGIENFSKIPKSDASQAKFVKCFNQLYACLNSAITQGFSWDKKEYEDKENSSIIKIEFTQEEYNILLLRYKEVDRGGSGDKPIKLDIPFNYQIVEESFKIDYNYMNQNFDKFVKVLFDENSSKEDIKSLKASLHKNFASFPKDRQVIAEMIINDFENGDLKIVEGWDFNDYINDYSVSKLDRQIAELVDFTGIDENKLKELMNLKLTEKNLDEFGRFTSLLDTADYDLITDNISKIKREVVQSYKSRIYLNIVLRKFLLEEPFSLSDYNLSLIHI